MEKIEVYDVKSQKLIGKINKNMIDEFYHNMRAKNYGVNVDNDGAIFIDKEDADDGGLSYQEQLNF
jgi:hypothetical protein